MTDTAPKDTLLIAGGKVVQVWRGTPKDKVLNAADLAGELVEVPAEPRAVAGMLWDGARATLPPPDPARLAAAIRREYTSRIADALQGKDASIAREAQFLQNLAFRSIALSAEQQADVALILEINAWETAMIEVREALIELGDASFADAAHWPAPPAGLTLDWLKGY